MRIPLGEYVITQAGTFHIWGVPHGCGSKVSVRRESPSDTVLEHMYDKGWLQPEGPRARVRIEPPPPPPVPSTIAPVIPPRDDPPQSGGHGKGGKSGSK